MSIYMLLMLGNRLNFFLASSPTEDKVLTIKY